MVEFQNKCDQAAGYEALWQTPQVFPLAIRMYPDSPQVVPQEFFRTQKASVMPTKSTARERLVAQL